MYKIKTGNIYEDFGNDKEMFGFSNCSTKSRYYDNRNKLLVGKMKDETVDVAITKFVGLKLYIYLYLVVNDSENKKAKGANNVVATISYS